MSAAHGKAILPVHNPEGCPWPNSCRDHRPTIPVEGRKRAYKARPLKACGKCGGPRDKPNLRRFVRSLGRYVSVCSSCVNPRSMRALPRFLSREFRQAVPA